MKFKFKGEDGKYHYLYKVTNTLNGRFYIGVRNSIQFDPGYYGSGKVIRTAIEKYGKENFTKEILSYHNSKEECYEEERRMLTEEFLEKHKSVIYNLKIGGFGGSNKGRKPRPWTEEQKKRNAEIHRGKIVSEKTRKLLSDINIKFSKEDEIEIINYYQKNVVTIRKTAEEFKCCTHTISKILKKYNIKRRSTSITQKGKKLSKEHKDKLTKGRLEYLKNHDTPFKGKKHTKESKRKMSERLYHYYKSHKHIRAIKTAWVDDDDNIIKIFESGREASKFTKCHPSDISAVCNGKKDRVKGFRFKHLKEAA